MASLRTRLLITLLYSWSFSYPLKADEWMKRLYASEDDLAKQLTAVRILEQIAKLRDKNVISKTGLYFAPQMRRNFIDASQLRAERKAVSQQKIAEINPLIHLCWWLPWVQGLAVTGSAAVENAQPDDDVDLMVVCSPNRLWLVRPMLILFSQLYGKRRTWRGEEGNSWCFNLWLEPSSLTVPISHRSLYTAYEVCQAHWMISKGKTRDWFFAANEWVSNLLPRYYLSANDERAHFEVARKQYSIFIISNCIDAVNYISFHIQYMYMRRHMTRERVSLYFAAFHPRDTRSQVMRALILSVKGTNFFNFKNSKN